MSKIDFLKSLDYELKFKFINELDDSYIVLNENTKKKYDIKKTTVSNNNWENIKSVLNGREPMIMDGITRIVGYYSKISNWNKSKLGELKDRRIGNYKVDGKCK